MDASLDSPAVCLTVCRQPTSPPARRCGLTHSVPERLVSDTYKPPQHSGRRAGPVLRAAALPGVGGDFGHFFGAGGLVAFSRIYPIAKW